MDEFHDNGRGLAQRPTTDGFRELVPGGVGWPNRVSDLGPAEPVTRLFVQGRAFPSTESSIAIVGTRRPTITGLEIAREMACALAEAGFCVVSGLAIGIDAAAHRGALEVGGHTVGVLGCGLNVSFPERNARLQRQIAARGTLVTEYPPGTPPLRHHFPARNRIIAGLVGAVIVVEGGMRSGALITARLATEANRNVYAVPGSPRNAVSMGPNHLIRSGFAALVTGPQDVFDLIAPETTWTEPFRPGVRAPLAETQLTVLHALETVPVTTDELAGGIGVAPGAVALALSQLELRGFARRTRAGLYLITEAGFRVSMESA
ncbi:MAG: DNA-processing protein DprA [Gaiellales bacterium]